MNDVAVAGLRPWLPWPLSRCRWWTEPVRAERLAALRIGLAAVLLLDILLTWWPHAGDYLGPRSLGPPELLDREQEAPWRGWSLLRHVESPWGIRLVLAAWTVAAVMLLAGLWTKTSALAAWILAVSVSNANPYVSNAGDQVRNILLLYLLLCPCGAAWSVDSWWSRHHEERPGPVLVHSWPVRLIFIQMVLIYFCNGLYKVAGADWRSGYSLYEVLCDPTLTRWSYAQLPVPFELTRLLTWLVMGWELSFPLLVCWRPTRLAALWFGVAFHLGIGLCLELGLFVPYMLCTYLPLLSWRRAERRKPPG